MMRLAFTAVAMVAAVAGAAVAAPPTTEGTVAGLDAEVHASWTRVPLQAWTARVTELAGRPVILDRRINPDLPVTLVARGEPLRDILGQVAAEAGAAVDELESTIRIVPTAVAGRATRADHDRRLRVARTSPDLRRRLVATEPWTWPPASRPRDLVTDLAAAAGLDIGGIDAIPHDHFPAADLPALSLAERLDLVLAHVDRRVIWDGRAGKPDGRIIAIDAEIAAAAITAANAPKPRSPSAVKPSRTVKVRDEFTLKLEAPLDQALAAITQQLDLDLELDVASLASSGIAPGEIVRADVVKATREGLFDAILRPVGLAWQLDGRRLRVFAVDPAGK
jgi:hypothetical protein